MSVSYKDLKTERQWSATAGLSEKRFVQLVIPFRESFKEVFGKELWERQSESSIESHLQSYEELLFFILFSLRSGLTYDALGFVFGMSGGNAKKIQSLGIRILKMALIKLDVMPKRLFTEVEEFESAINEDEIIKMDGIEQAVQRPVNQEDQKDMYSGKKKTHR